MKETVPPKTLWTIGHSTHSSTYFMSMLKAFDIEVLADIRKLPGSRKYPHFNQENLKETLWENGIVYLYLPELTGRRKARPDSANTAWRNQSFKGYADYMETADFMHGIQSLIAVASEKRTAIMCAEAVWWRCHRSMVADYLKSIGWTVIHILDDNKCKIHPYTSAANTETGKLNYHGNSTLLTPKP